MKLVNVYNRESLKNTAKAMFFSDAATNKWAEQSNQKQDAEIAAAGDIDAWRKLHRNDPQSKAA